MNKCKKCKTPIEDKFCHLCGHPAAVARINRTYITQQVQQLFNIDRGFLFTAKELLLRPGKAIREFILEDRSKYVKPVVFLLFTSVILVLTAYLLNITYTYISVDNMQVFRNKVDTGVIGKWLNSNIGYVNLALGCFVALWTKVLFRKSGYNFYEIVVVLCFVLGEATLIFCLAFVLGKVTGSALVAAFFILLFLVYTIWAIGQFFGARKWLNYVKALLVMLLGNVSYMAVMVLIGLILKVLSPSTANQTNDTVNKSIHQKELQSVADSTPGVTGIGGIFFFSENPKNTKQWYANNLGMQLNDWGVSFEFRNANRPNEINYLQWSPFSDSSQYFVPSEKEFMINYRVRHIDALVKSFRENGVAIVDSIVAYDYGKFVHIMDADGNKIELWEPIDSVLTSYGGKTTK